MAAQPSGSAEELRRDAAEELPLTGGELAALRALGGELDAEQMAADAGYAAQELWQGVEPGFESPAESELAENRHYKRDNSGRFAETGAATHSHKGGRGSKGNPKNPTTQSNTPLKAAPGANPQAQVDVADHAMKATAKKGKVKGAAHANGKPVNVDAGHPDYYETRHASKHFNPGDTDRRSTARAIGAGKSEKVDGGIFRTHKGKQAILKPDKEREGMKFITGYKK